MAKNIRTSGNYTIRSGTGSSGTTILNLAAGTIDLDSNTLRVRGNLQVDGTQTVVDSQTLEIEDAVLVLARNNSGTDIDSGIKIDRGGQGNDALFYWNEGDDTFKAVTTSSDGTGTSIADTALAKIQVAEPAAASDAATKNYVDSTSGVSLSGSTNNTITTVTGANALQGEANLTFDGTTLAVTGNITATTSIANDAITIDDHTIKTTRSNDDLILEATGTGNVVINDTLTFSSMASDPTATTQTIVYNKTAGGGGTGLYFRNSNIGSGAVGELISKSKATALAIALG